MVTGSAHSLAVIVPAWQAAELLPRSLQALVDAAEGQADLELIVVDPASTDGTGAVARRLGARVLRLERRAGPAHARNVGVDATRAELLLFVDADCVAHPDLIERVRAHFADPELVSVMGSYDDDPPEQNFASLYMNLRHHYVHHHDGRREPASFWTGCGAVRREAFLRAGGFDAERYPWPSIEDIELGTRLRPLGRTRLDPELRVKHLKRWTIASVVQTDVYSRALPWSKLIVERGELPDDLNLRLHHRVAAAFAPLTLLALLVLPLAVLARAGSLATLCILVLLASLAVSRRMLAFFHARRGTWFALRAWLFHQVHLSYSAATFAIVLVRHRLERRRARRQGAAA